MELQAKARHLPFMTAATLLKDRFGIRLDNDTFVERAYYIWRSIGNIATDLKTATVKISDDLVVTLPQDCEFIRSLSTDSFQDESGSDGSYGDYNFNSSGKHPESKPDPTITSIEANVRASISTQPGELISYKTYNGYLKVASPLMAGRSATLIYNTIVKDEDGLPLLNDLEVEAIAITMALREAEAGLFRKDPTAQTTVQYLSPLSERALCAAKADEKISDDGFDRMLDIKTSWGRKVYGSRFNMY